MKKALLFLILLVVVLTGLLLPKYILNQEASSQLNTVTTLSQSEIKVNPTIMKNASIQLTQSERMQLISQQWQSDLIEAKENEGDLTKSQAAELAKKQIKALYDNGHYPVDLTSGYNNWYKWDATLYKAVDSHFHTYAAYYWQFHFVRYDNSETHTINMMEDGTILYANTDAVGSDRNQKDRSDSDPKDVDSANVSTYSTANDSGIKPFSKEEFQNATIIRVKPSQITTLPFYEKTYNETTVYRSTNFYDCIVLIKGNTSITDISQIKPDDEYQKYSEYYILYETKDHDNNYVYCHIPYVKMTK